VIIKSKINIRTQEDTTTFMVASPTPLAPAPALIPWWYPIKKIRIPKTNDFTRPEYNSRGTN
jgi:hypothetical protein